MRKTRVFSTVAPNFACVFEKGIVLIQDNGSYLLFLKDQNQANQVMALNDKSSILAIRDSLKTEIDKVNTPILAAAKAADEAAGKREVARTKVILSLSERITIQIIRSGA